MSEFSDELFRKRTIKQDGFKVWLEYRWSYFKCGMDYWPGIRHWNKWWYGVDSEPVHGCVWRAATPSRYLKYWVIPAMRRQGFTPFYYTWYAFEHTFIFATTEEAHRASRIFELGKKPIVQAWWYGLNDLPEIDENFPFPERETWYDLSKR